MIKCSINIIMEVFLNILVMGLTIILEDNLVIMLK